MWPTFELGFGAVRLESSGRRGGGGEWALVGRARCFPGPRGPQTRAIWEPRIKWVGMLAGIIIIIILNWLEDTSTSYRCIFVIMILFTPSD